jgi:argininosuccinate lyase
MSRLWDKGAPLDERVLRYTAGEDHALDNRLVAYDARASIAHAEMLNANGLLSPSDLDAIRQGLLDIAAEHARGEWQVQLEHEDGQTALETLLTQRIGEAGKRVHLGRSRNDQVLTALRLYLKDVVDELAARSGAVADALDQLSQREGDIQLPGYTHMQQAMPSSVALWAGGFAAELRDDAAAMAQVRQRIDKSPLGSAAGYGSPNLPIDREDTRQRLGFASVHEPVTAVQLSRGKAESQLLFEIALVMQDVGRLSADLMLFYTQEFAFVSLPDAFTTGSSIMPQKRNPDAAELVRAKTGRIIGALMQMLVVMKGLPLAYSKDMQEDKESTFDALATFSLVIAAMTGMVGDLVPNEKRMKAAASEGYATATDLADHLVQKLGIPFRESHEITGKIVALAAKEGITLEQMTIKQMRTVDPRIPPSALKVLAAARSVESRTSYGGTAPKNVAAQADKWLKRLGK